MYYLLYSHIMDSHTLYIDTTSSIDFCEENYYITPYIAEFHNTWSSAIMMIPPFIGLIYSNPTYESRTSILFGFLILIFFGSTFFHATLDKFEQSMDEIPMLLFNNAALYALFNYNTIHSGRRNNNAILLFYGFVSGFQIIIYHIFQETYYAFLLQYIVTTTLLVSKSYKTTVVSGITQKNPKFTDDSTAINNINNEYNVLYTYSIYCYVFTGVPVWVIEIANCAALLPFYRSIYGCTLHVLWHFGAGMGGYYMVLYLTCLRLQAIGGKPEIKWVYLCPVIENGYRGISQRDISLCFKNKANHEITFFA